MFVYTNKPLEEVHTVEWFTEFKKWFDTEIEAVKHKSEGSLMLIKFIAHVDEGKVAHLQYGGKYNKMDTTLIGAYPDTPEQKSMLADLCELVKNCLAYVEEVCKSKGYTITTRSTYGVAKEYCIKVRHK